MLEFGKELISIYSLCDEELTKVDILLEFDILLSVFESWILMLSL